LLVAAYVAQDVDLTADSEQAEKRQDWRAVFFYQHWRVEVVDCRGTVTQAAQRGMRLLRFDRDFFSDNDLREQKGGEE